MILSDGTNTGFIERDDLMSSVAFWYQAEPHRKWPPFPPGPERLIYKSQAPLFAAWTADRDASLFHLLLNSSEGVCVLHMPGDYQAHLFYDRCESTQLDCLLGFFHSAPDFLERR